jgi:hypothetical protein
MSIQTTLASEELLAGKCLLEQQTKNEKNSLICRSAAQRPAVYKRRLYVEANLKEEQ